MGNVTDLGRRDRGTRHVRSKTKLENARQLRDEECDWGMKILQEQDLEDA